REDENFTKIIDNLYLTSAKHLTNENLVNFSITHIVNATRTVPLKREYRCLRVNVSGRESFSRALRFTKLFFPVQILDSAYENIGAHFDTVSDFINNALD